jgi:hypothetical protein
MQCAFCSSPAVDHGGEHPWSDWMNKIITRKRFTFASFKQEGEKREHRVWKRRKLDEKLPVVCQPCNNGWMSDLENKEAKPAIKDLILSDKLVTLSPERLRSIARFAFKTAVIADHYSMSAGQSPFFSTVARYRFRETLQVPGGVQMWISAFKESGHGALRCVYHSSSAKARHGFELYALTFGVGYFLVQVVGSKWLDPTDAPAAFPFLFSGKHWDKFSAPFWPSNGQTIQWPLDKQFNLVWMVKFCQRWRQLSIPGNWL